MVSCPYGAAQCITFIFCAAFLRKIPIFSLRLVTTSKNLFCDEFVGFLPKPCHFLPETCHFVTFYFSEK